jgi:plasmid stabilization system protein ParE
MGDRVMTYGDWYYFLPYRVRGDVVEILGVIHGRQRWPED